MSSENWNAQVWLLSTEPFGTRSRLDDSLGCSRYNEYSSWVVRILSQSTFDLKTWSFHVTTSSIRMVGWLFATFVVSIQKASDMLAIKNITYMYYGRYLPQICPQKSEWNHECIESLFCRMFLRASTCWISLLRIWTFVNHTVFIQLDQGFLNIRIQI